MRSSLEFLQVIFRHFVPELWPLIYAKISFPLNILRINWQNFTNFVYAFILTISSMGLLHVIFAHLYQNYGPWLMPKFGFSSIC